MPVVAGGLTVQQGLTEVTLTTRVDQSGSLKVSRKGRVIIEVEWPPC